MGPAGTCKTNPVRSSSRYTWGTETYQVSDFVAEYQERFEVRGDPWLRHMGTEGERGYGRTTRRGCQPITVKENVDIEVQKR